VDAGGDPKLILNPAKMSPREASAQCMTCHNRGAHAAWEGSAHDVRQLSCSTCHSVHHFTSVEAQLKTRDQTTLCATCHRDKVAKLDRSGHMPLREGKMECTSCHNPHGSQNNVRLLNAGSSVTEFCATCHTDKRGPFLYEHAPVRENCTTCHDPHGSSNERMLVAKMPILCQRCHIHTRHPSTIYDNLVVNSSNRLYARSCVTCHANIHGSNHPSGGTFLR
jgi:DmsE family decaheme c-type cytochrome